MKTLTTLTLAFVLWLTAPAAHAQEYKYKLGNNAGKAIEFSISRSDIIIEGHASDEVVIRNMDYEAPPERAKGLHALYNSAQDNTGIGLSVQEDNGVLKVVQASRNSGEYRVMVPNNVRVSVEQVNYGGGDVEIDNHNGEIEVESKTGDIHLKNVTGPITASSVSGDVEVVLSKLSQANPTSISLVSGYIDMTVPADSKADFNLSSVSGEIYTDLDLNVKGNKDDMRLLGGRRQIEAALNGGGVHVSLKSISGEIYLRKQK